MSKSKVNIVSYIDANYLYKAIICYESLQEKFPKFTLYLYCFDEITYKIIKELKYPNIKAFRKNEFEIPEILSQKFSKKSYEYFWTYTPSVLLKTMSMVSENDLVIYMDMDMMFFDNPECILKELEDKDVLIQPNNFSVKERWQFEPVGYYCTSFNVFRNNKNTRKIVKIWQKECIKWCGSSFDKDKFGDQKYLDYWKDTYKKVREISVIGANIAPWNIHKYDVSTRNGKVYINNNKLIYYHFHSFKMNFTNYKYIIEGDRDNHYEIRKDAVENIYLPYIKRAKIIIKKLKKYKIFNEYIKRNPYGNVGWYGNE